MREQDVAECAQIVATHPSIGPRYRGAVDDLRLAWLRLTACPAARAIVFEEVGGAGARIAGIGVTVFVTDDFLLELKTPPLQWFGPQLARRIAGGRSPFLSDKRLREANSDGGLNLVMWEICTRPEDARTPELLTNMVSALIEAHRGFCWKEMIGGQAESVERLKTMLKLGALLWNSAESQYVETPAQDLESVVAHPHILGVRRDANPAQLMSWLGTLFDYHPPQIGFSPGEQRLLALALTGWTDAELSEKMGISVSGVKKMWASIHTRMARSTSGAMRYDFAESHDTTAGRGREKKRHVLAYLRAHPEELCPVSRRVLGLHSAARPTNHSARMHPALDGLPVASLD